VPKSVSSLWHSQPDGGIAELERSIDAGCGAAEGPPMVFFRADDVGIPGRQFLALMDLFARYRVPLSLAVVPAWLNRERWAQVQRAAGEMNELWCWHQHGWRHLNHERSGKKQEFGPSLSAAQLRGALLKGRTRLEMLMEDRFYPVFTPPWNRCDPRTLQLLKELGYYAVSRSSGNQPMSPQGLPDLAVNGDLHTRKETDGATGYQHLLGELRQGLSSGLCGIMIHHQRMNRAALGFLEDLLRLLAHQKRPRKHIRLVSFPDIIEKT
jgi:peptidoglycan/xylan/chitin deacetylase (PgdA/CDA1 family)